MSGYRPGTSIDHIAQVIDFDRDLRMLVMEGVERIEVALRMRVGYVLGRRSAFAHLDAGVFLPSFVEHRVDGETGWRTLPSKHAAWLQRVAERRDSSDETFVNHFRENYEGQMPLWALTEILELGHLSRLYQGLNEDDAGEIAEAFGVPTKKLMASWLASVNYVRNVAAHHARLYNRKLQNAPGRPKAGIVPLLDHLREGDSSKSVFGVYNALAVIAYLLRSIDADVEWRCRLVSLLRAFPSSPDLDLESLGVPQRWAALELWRTQPYDGRNAILLAGAQQSAN
ncbi:Abi family protein [Cellulomonas timonensis]|uniref:Abi family protein n=1 Tax=Cellulomonas timonensis TaxID=1689271 RepID=UPI001F228EDC|nr:Abi family protein [Cellulomonas timonensis]